MGETVGGPQFACGTLYGIFSQIAIDDFGDNYKMTLQKLVKLT